MRSAFWLFAPTLGLMILALPMSGRAQDTSTSLTNSAPAVPDAQPLSLGPAPASVTSGPNLANNPDYANLPIPLAQAKALLQQGLDLCNQHKFNEAIGPLTQLLKAIPGNIQGLTLRGYAYSQKKEWGLAQADFQTILQVAPNYSLARFNLSELEFQQKLYDKARPGFDSLRNNPDLGDLAGYKVFLCDLFAGHTVTAESELDVFNAVGSDPSYYFGNAAWELYHGRPEAARPWLASALRIYYPARAQNYTSSLVQLGYLPLPPPPPGAPVSVVPPLSPSASSSP